MLPEVMQNVSIWGGTGYLLKSIHTTTGLPYWACFSMISIIVRTTLFPLVIMGAHNLAKSATVAVELQLFASIFTNDYKTMRAAKADWREFVLWARMGYQGFRGIYKTHKVNVLAPFYSPLLQLPIFLYVSTDLRKLVNGRDPLLAQDLTSTASGWLEDLTEPDPTLALPILAGVAFYTNVETAMGRRSLAGNASSKANLGIQLKDIFQSVAIFMPCFVSHNPAGLQVYLCTSFAFTIVQGYALRNEQFREWMGLPPLNRAPVKPLVGGQFADLKKLEMEADELRGDGPLLGTGVLGRNWRLSFAGTNRPSTIEIPIKDDDNQMEDDDDDSHLHIIKFFVLIDNQQTPYNSDMPFIPGISASMEEMAERKKQEEYQKLVREKVATEYLEKVTSGQELTEEQLAELMEKANRGEKPVLTQFVVDKSKPTGNPRVVTRVSRKSSSPGKKKKKKKKRRNTRK